MSRLRWAKFFWEDWASDNALSLCTLAAQGLWMRMLCIAAQGDDYGMLTVNGQPVSDEELAKLIRPHIDPRRFARLLAELERKKVVSRDANGTLFCRRMTQLRLAFDSHFLNGKRGASKRYGIVRHSLDARSKNQEADKGESPPSTPYQDSPLNPPPLRAGGLHREKINGKATHHEPGGIHARSGGGDPATKRAGRRNHAGEDVVVPLRPGGRRIHR